MRVILRQTVKGLGDRDAVVTVADGYARNYLVPRGLAVAATAAGLKEVETNRARHAARAERDLQDANEVRARLEGRTVEITKRAGESGRLFGSVTTQDIANAIRAQTDTRVDRRRIEITDVIKTLGTYSVDVRLHPQVSVAVGVEVRAEGQPATAAPSPAE